MVHLKLPSFLGVETVRMLRYFVFCLLYLINCDGIFLSVSVANILLWKDKKQTLATLLLVAILYYYLFAFGYTFITAVAKLVSVTALFLFVHSLLPTKVYAPSIYRPFDLYDSSFLISYIYNIFKHHLIYRPIIF